MHQRRPSKKVHFPLPLAYKEGNEGLKPLRGQTPPCCHYVLALRRFLLAAAVFKGQRN